MRGKIHFLVPGSITRCSGGTRYDAHMAAALRRRGHDVAVHELAGRYPAPDDAAREAARRAQAKVTPGDVVVLDGLALAAFDPNAGWPDGAWRVLLLHMRLARERGLPPDVRAELDGAERRWLDGAHRVVVPSRYLARCLVRRGVPRRRIAVVEPGTDPPGARARPGAGASRAGTAGVRILTVGAVTALKGHRVLVRALSYLRSLPWSLEIVGPTDVEPAAVAALENAIRHGGLASRVCLAGAVDPSCLPDVYRRADVFVLPSYFESYGMALAEAAANGLPLVATRAGAVPSTTAGRAARLVPPGDARTLAEALAPLLTDATARTALASAALAAARRLPTWRHAGRRFAAEISKIARAT